MRRVLIIGSGRAGKSALARRMAERLSLLLIHLDRMYWHHGWKQTPKEEWRRTVESVVAGEASS